MVLYQQVKGKDYSLLCNTTGNKCWCNEWKKFKG